MFVQLVFDDRCVQRGWRGRALRTLYLADFAPRGLVEAMMEESRLIGPQIAGFVSGRPSPNIAGSDAIT